MTAKELILILQDYPENTEILSDGESIVYQDYCECDNTLDLY